MRPKWPEGGAWYSVAMFKLLAALIVLAVPALAGNRSTKGPQQAIPPLPAQAVRPQVQGLGAAAGAAGAAQAAPGAKISETLAVQADGVAKAAAADPTGGAAAGAIDAIYNGGGRGASVDVRSEAMPSGFALSDEGVWLMDRAARYFREVKRMARQLEPHMEVAETLDVFDDTIADVRSKLVAVEAVAKERQITQANTHLDQTLTWVDGMLIDGPKAVAVHTHRVFFHPAKNPQSEIKEGIRRVSGYLEQAASHFAVGGQVERQFDASIDKVVLAFDTRGYQEIKDHLKAAEKDFQKRFPGRYEFKYVDELAPVLKTTQAVRDDYNRLVRKYKDEPEGLQKVMEGVMYSRYVGVLLELKTMEHKHKLGYTILQSGRDLFDANGHYVTEGDTVVRSPNGEVEWIEAKSARVGLPFEEVMRDKIYYKLDIYKKNQALMEKTIGGPLKVVFSMDPGGRDARAAAQGLLVWRNPEQKILMEKLQAQAPMLSKKYGFPVEFLFLNSQPGEDPMLFYKKAVDADQFYASQRGPNGGRSKNDRREKKKRFGR